MKTLIAGNTVSFDYTNHRGETSMRRVIVRGVDYGDNEWYRERQWFLRCFDIDKQADRSFAFAKIDAETLAFCI